MTTILLAEDNPDNAETIVDYLEAHHYTVLLAENGKTAVEMVISEKPSLVLMDIHMPVMDGIQAIKMIRDNPQMADLPIIAITALAMPGDRERILASGANEYISKPVKLKTLLQRCNHYVDFQPPEVAPDIVEAEPPARLDFNENTGSAAQLVLIADDDEATLSAYEDILSIKGFQCILARNGVDAVNLAKEQLPEVIIMDVQLPKMDGLKVTRALRQDSLTEHIPIIILTGLTSSTDRRRSLDAGATVHLNKPVSLWTLLDEVKSVIKH